LQLGGFGFESRRRLTRHRRTSGSPLSLAGAPPEEGTSRERIATERGTRKQQREEARSGLFPL
jgi:hypothetical protein